LNEEKYYIPKEEKKIEKKIENEVKSELL